MTPDIGTQPLRSRPAWALTVRTAFSWAAICLCLCLAATTLAAADSRLLRQAELLPGLTGLLQGDGTLVFQAQSGDEPVLKAVLVTPGKSRRSRHRGEESVSYLGRTVEGAVGGHRGLSATADDDNDGLRDEDRLDGRDNDGDGRIDEDYAAISDEMIAIGRGTVADGSFEYYHWAYPHLKSTIFANLRAADGSTWSLTSGGSAWVDVAVTMHRHTVTGRGIDLEVGAFVSQMNPDAACSAGGGRWLGVIVLDEPAGGIGRAYLDGRTLGVTVGNQRVAVAVCAADSWLQLSRMLIDAKRIRDGVSDPVSGERVPWIAAPLCAACRRQEAPDYRWRIEEDGNLVLASDIDNDHAILPDPDLVSIAGHPLGSAAEIRWVGADGGEQGISWSCVTAAQLSRSGRRTDPWSVLSATGWRGVHGRLELVYHHPGSDILNSLTGAAPGVGVARALILRTVDGRELQVGLAADLLATDPVRSAVALVSGGPAEDLLTPAAQSLVLRENETRPTLSPDLLQGWPNPFRDVITIRFTVPATIGEAFRWDHSEDQPEGVDLTAPVPWRSGVPDATVKIYTISGQELVTLHTGISSPGGATVNWRGIDSLGRKVASGTYFCKLQLDQWSVTRRLVYIR